MRKNIEEWMENIPGGMIIFRAEKAIWGQIGTGKRNYDHVLGGYQARRAAFEHFMREGETNGKDLSEPGYKGFLYFNLSKSAPVLKYDGIRYIPAGKEMTYTYDDHFEFVTSRMFNGEERRTAQKFSRNRLLTYYQSGKRTLQTNLRYLCRGGGVNIHTDFTMTENPDTGDVIVLVQNENNSTEMLFERIIRTVSGIGTVFLFC
ncbi:hypothetical protein ACTQ56_10880 [[Clostridium] aminophilum]|uniref:hypothetical protein n=1 Tax=[Clostridium] aminophilum TaxID=1526 RepID=UPI003F9C4D71